VRETASCHHAVTEADTTAHVALGANLPLEGAAPAETVAAAIAALEGLPARVIAASRVYATPCVPAGAGPDYANAVVRLATPLSARALMADLHALEARYERQRSARWGARTLDLDLLDHGGAVAPDRSVWAFWAGLPAEEQRIRTPDRLILPHPRLQARAFVLVPLAEISPDWRHPVLGTRAADLRDGLPAAELASIRALGAASSLAKQGDAR
jgi:2-amino-4-hydroxy-6-hydroxymethyldihydropteridine diphosphokinase